MWWIPIFWVFFDKGIALPNNLLPSPLKLKKNWKSCLFKKKNNFFNFSLISKWIAVNCLGERSPYRKIYKKNPPPHIRGGRAHQFSYQHFFRGKQKVQGLPPPLIYIYIFFIIFSIRGLLFQTIWCLLFQNRRKIERLTQFPKKLPAPPYFQIYSSFLPFETFFLNCVNRSIFVWY